MTPTIYREGPYRFFFFSREESRPHIHVVSSKGEAKFWLEPTVALADHDSLSAVELRKLQRIIEKRQNEFKTAWKKYFG